MNFVPGRIPLGGKSPKCIYSVPVHETAKYRAKFGLPPLSDVGAVTSHSPTAENRQGKKEKKETTSAKYNGPHNKHHPTQKHKLHSSLIADQYKNSRQSVTHNVLVLSFFFVQQRTANGQERTATCLEYYTVYTLTS